MEPIFTVGNTSISMIFINNGKKYSSKVNLFAGTKGLKIYDSDTLFNSEGGINSKRHFATTIKKCFNELVEKYESMNGKGSWKSSLYVPLEPPTFGFDLTTKRLNVVIDPFYWEHYSERINIYATTDIMELLFDWGYVMDSKYKDQKGHRFVFKPDYSILRMLRQRQHNTCYLERGHIVKIYI